MALLAALPLATTALAPARASVGDAPSPGATPVTTTWFLPVSPEAQAVDRRYLAGMRPHHAGALSMSRDYLADPGRSSPLLQALARAIQVNQAQEIAVLDEVARNLDAPPLRLPWLGLTLQPVATEGLGDRQRFFKAPIPSPAADRLGAVSARDVLFAKAMILHHQAALDMARAYHAEPRARNGFLGLMNGDILADQAQEIALMRLVVATYPGDAAQLRVDPAMVHGMEGMAHGHAAPEVTPEPAAATTPAAPPAAQRHGPHH